VVELARAIKPSRHTQRYESPPAVLALDDDTAQYVEAKSQPCAPVVQTENVGVCEGRVDGAVVGRDVGITVGVAVVGAAVGSADGAVVVGTVVGVPDGAVVVGAVIGAADGAVVVGMSVGTVDGAVVGNTEG
jgi:hypothetical protein